MERENDANDAADDAAGITTTAPVAPNAVVAATFAARVAPTIKTQEKRCSHRIPCPFSSSSIFLIEDHSEFKQQ